MHLYWELSALCSELMLVLFGGYVNTQLFINYLSFSGLCTQTKEDKEFTEIHVH